MKRADLKRKLVKILYRVLLALGLLLAAIPIVLRLPIAERATSIAGALGAGIVGGIAVALIGLGNNLRRKATMRLALPAEEIMRLDPRPPVLYLRSFQDDSVGARQAGIPTQSFPVRKFTQDEQLVRALKHIGPVIALGPEGPPPAPAPARLRVPDQGNWQQEVTALMHAACLVVVRVATTEGLRWEIEQATKCLPPQKLVLLFVSHDPPESEALLASLNALLPRPISQPSSERGLFLNGAVYFTPDWEPVYLPSRYNPPMVEAWQLRFMLRPVFEQLGLPRDGFEVRIAKLDARAAELQDRAAAQKARRAASRKQEKSHKLDKQPDSSRREAAS